MGDYQTPYILVIIEFLLLLVERTQVTGEGKRRLGGEDAPSRCLGRSGGSLHLARHPACCYLCHHSEGDSWLAAPDMHLRTDLRSNATKCHCMHVSGMQAKGKERNGKERKDYTCQVQLRAFRTGSLTNKLTEVLPPRLTGLAEAELACTRATCGGPPFIVLRHIPGITQGCSEMQSFDVTADNDLVWA
eukprot:1150545-Pelagomonas_calceolata.AAC.2